MTSKTWHVRTLLIVSLGVLVAPVAHGEEALTIDITPQVCLEGANVRVTVRVDPDPDNRLLLIEADSASFFRSSEIQPSGDRAPCLRRTCHSDSPSLTRVRMSCARLMAQSATACWEW
jgi:hypothetical protein